MMPFGFTCLDYINRSIRDAEQGKSKLHPEILEIDGMSSPKVRHFLNNMGFYFTGYHYMEIGTYKGSTLVSAGYGNAIKLTAIDNWSEFDGPSYAFHKNVEKWLPDNRLNFFEHHAFLVKHQCITHINGKVGVFFYDGGHDVESQMQAFIYYNPIFEDTFIAIVDDWNMDSAKEGTREAFRVLKYKVVREWELPAKFNGDKENWWNGLYVALVRK